MDYKERNAKIADAIEKASTVAVMPSKVAGVEAFCAGVGLVQMLLAKEKKVTLIYQGSVPDGYSDLLDSALIKSSVASRELVVSIDYSTIPEAVAQYSNNNNVLYIRLTPVSKDFDLSKVTTKVTGDEYDLVFTLGAQVLEDFGQVYKDMAVNLYKTQLVNIDNTDRNTNFGNYNVLDTFENSLSMIVLNISRFWRLRLTDTSAIALLKGITYKRI